MIQEQNFFKKNRLFLIIAAIAIVILASASLIYFYYFSEDKLFSDSVAAARKDPLASGMDNYEVKTRHPSSLEIKEYPVIYEGATADSVVVEFYDKSTSNGALCIVEKKELLRCFNNIKIG